MLLRAFIFASLILSLLALPLQDMDMGKDPWLELEKGLRLDSVENIFYQTSCLLGEDAGERILESGIEMLESGLPVTLECGLFMQEGFENEEVLFLVRGTDRQACSELWRRVEASAGCSMENSARSWSVEAWLSGDHDLISLGRELVEALGGGLKSAQVNSRMVQLLAYLPWAGEGFFLDEGPVNLQLELYRIAGAGKVRVRAGIPALRSMPF